MKEKGLCFQGFIECFLIISTMIFNESSLDLNLKSLIYYCKYILNKDKETESTILLSIKQQDQQNLLNQLIDLTINDSLFPLSQNLTSLIESNELKYPTSCSTYLSSQSIIPPASASSSTFSSNNLNSESSLSSLSSDGAVSIASLNSMDANELKDRINMLLNKKQNKKSLFPIFVDTTVI